MTDKPAPRRGRGPRGGKPTDEDKALAARQDGFRPRRKRPKGWYEKALKRGEVRAPGAPDPDAGKVYTGTVIEVPMATAAVTGEE